MSRQVNLQKQTPGQPRNVDVLRQLASVNAVKVIAGSRFSNIQNPRETRNATAALISIGYNLKCTATHTA